MMDTERKRDRTRIAVGMALGAMLAAGLPGIRTAAMHFGNSVGEYSYTPPLVPGIVVQPLLLTLREDGPERRYRIHLRSQPADDVFVRIIAGRDLNVEPDLIRFSTDDWSRPQRVAVVAPKDALREGRETVFIRHRARSPGDDDYDGMRGPRVRVVVREHRCLADSLPLVLPIPLPCRLPQLPIPRAEPPVVEGPDLTEPVPNPPAPEAAAAIEPEPQEQVGPRREAPAAEPQAPPQDDPGEEPEEPSGDDPKDPPLVPAVPDLPTDPLLDPAG